MKGDFLFLDIDGCLSRGKYAPFDVAALQALAALAQNAETEVVLCTGRSLSYVEAIAQFVRFGRYAVTDQGALLYDYLEDEVVFAPQLTPPVRERIAALAQYLAAHGDQFAVRWKMSHGKEACVSLVAEKGKRAEDVRAVVAQFGDGFADVGKGFVAAFFRVGVRGIPAAHEFFQGRDVEVAVMEVVFEGRHEARHEAAILADAIATER